MKSVLLFAFVALTASFPLWSEARSQIVTVTMDNTKFSPEHITVKVGDWVEWKNTDLVPHTATADDNSFDSKVVDQNANWKHKFTKKGTIPYHCQLHTTMKGQITVE